MEVQSIIQLKLKEFITLTCPTHDMRGHGFLCLIHVETSTSSLISILTKPVGNRYTEKQIADFPHISRETEDKKTPKPKVLLSGSRCRGEELRRKVLTISICFLRNTKRTDANPYFRTIFLGQHTGDVLPSGAGHARSEEVDREKPQVHR